MSTSNLLPSLLRLAQLQGQRLDTVALQDIASKINEAQAPAGQLRFVLTELRLGQAKTLTRPDFSDAPALVHSSDLGWGVLRGSNAQQEWVSDWFDASSQTWVEQSLADVAAFAVYRVRLAKPFRATRSPVFRLVLEEFFSHRRTLFDAALGGIFINLLALLISFYSMQVYNRVIPTGASQTLLVLTSGVLISVVLEHLAKLARSHLYEAIIDQVDTQLARSIFVRFLSLRLDNVPQNVGSMASTLRGYESVRGFLTTCTTQLVDLPFALVFFVAMASIGGVLVLVPLIFFIACIALGLYYRRQIEHQIASSIGTNNEKTGLLVETIEGGETIKSGHAGWRILGRWMQLSETARTYDLESKRITDHSLYLTTTLQQFSYILTTAFGAILISQGAMTMGALIACSLMAGRILSPVAALPNHLISWASTRAALIALDRIWSLEDDHHGHENPVAPGQIHGHYLFEDVQSHYAGRLALDIPQLSIQPGEKVGVLGPIGSGKTTLLRLLSGMYKPQQGRILLDHADLSVISKPVLAEHLGYLQQEARLFAGTLRDNLILGMPDPGDDAILAAAQQTGLLETVIKPHPKGLQQAIFEGGRGLSGGQRQLVHLSRLFLRRPSLWLLDEPTASMDAMMERSTIALFKKTLRATDTLVLVTHRNEMLDLVDRLVVVSNHQIVMDGPRDAVLRQLQSPPAPNAATAPA